MMLEADEDLSLERDAMEASLDDGTNPAEFDANIDGMKQAQTEIDNAFSKRNQEIVNELQGWLNEIQAFLKILNSEDSTSMQSRLANAEADTIFDKMKQSQQTKISRVASDLASLEQAFLGFMAQTKNPKYKYVLFPIAFSLSLLQMGMSYFG
jgi:Skp family chaperone for outer membrane proteins